MTRNVCTKFLDEEGNFDASRLPKKWAICPCCEGHGRSSAYLGAFTRSDRDEMGSDEWNTYMNGRYDRICDDCLGEGKVQIVDQDRLDAATLEAWADDCKADADYRASVEAERRMGC